MAIKLNWQKEAITQLIPNLTALLGCREEDIGVLGGYQNLLLEVNLRGQPLVIRITGPHQQKGEAVEEELKFIQYLHEGGVPVAPPVRLSEKKFTETIEAGEKTYHISLFEKIAAGTWQEVPQGYDTFFQAGKALGRIHTLSRVYPPTPHRRNWWENPYLTTFPQVIPEEKAFVIEKFQECLSALNHLPKGEGIYGLIHGDYNFGNLLYSETSVTVIDFDELEYGWYGYDIGVYLFYYLLGADPEHMDIEGNRHVFRNFIAGYERECTCPDISINNLSLFFRLREFILYSSIYRSLPEKGWNPWAEKFIESVDGRLRRDEPFVPPSAFP